jgi:hypothetical protein
VRLHAADWYADLFAIGHANRTAVRDTDRRSVDADSRANSGFLEPPPASACNGLAVELEKFFRLWRNLPRGAIVR